MTNNKGKTYRKLWEQKYGPIPVDENGVSYDIHHINGDRSDNRIENLMCVSMKDHYDIHLKQGDVMACCAIMRRINQPVSFSDDERSRLSKQAHQAAIKRVNDGTHNFLGGTIQAEHQRRRKEEGTHNFVGNSNPNYVKLPDGTYTTVINCVDKSGKNLRITKDEYKNQTGPVEEWKYVVRNSNEGRRRVSKIK
jgi:HNH endonuclease